MIKQVERGYCDGQNHRFKVEAVGDFVVVTSEGKAVRRMCPDCVRVLREMGYRVKALVPAQRLRPEEMVDPRWRE